MVLTQEAYWERGVSRGILFTDLAHLMTRMHIGIFVVFLERKKGFMTSQGLPKLFNISSFAFVQSREM